MAMSSISSAASAVQQLQQPSQTPKALQPEATKSAAELLKAEEAKKAQQPLQAQAQNPEPASPVTNAQGQRTGTVINITA